MVIKSSANIMKSTGITLPGTDITRTTIHYFAPDHLTVRRFEE
jgi:hypothetical protein